MTYREWDKSVTKRYARKPRREKFSDKLLTFVAYVGLVLGFCTICLPLLVMVWYYAVRWGWVS